MPSFYKLQITAISRETTKAVVITFAVPSELQPNYTFIAGQYVNLKLTLDGQEIRRAYSICSSPKSGVLQIAVKAVANGVFSNFANQNLKVGDLIAVGTPEGKFVFEPHFDKQKNYAAFVSGSGITPVISIIKSVLESEPQSSFVLVYGNKSVEETIFCKQLHDLLMQNPGRFFVEYVFSQAKIEGNLFGRIDKPNINFLLNKKHKEKQFDKFYLCGPEEMINLTTNVLKENNVAEKDIKFELFVTKENKVFNENMVNNFAKITILVDNESFDFEMSPKQTILEAALKQGLDVPYSCQGGVCSSCLARVTEGTAMMSKNAILTDAEIADGLVLTCQAHPTSTSITIDYDDV